MERAFAIAAAVVACCAGATVAAQETPEFEVRELIVYGADPCPRSTQSEIVVCVRRPEQDRYRIPEPFRRNPEAPENQSWAARAETLEYVGRTGIQSCSVVGPGSWTGCWAEMMRQAREDRRVDPEGQPVP